jgi:hypothetical protein
MQTEAMAELMRPVRGCALATREIVDSLAFPHGKIAPWHIG